MKQIIISRYDQKLLFWNYKKVRPRRRLTRSCFCPVKWNQLRSHMSHTIKLRGSYVPHPLGRRLFWIVSRSQTDKNPIREEENVIDMIYEVVTGGKNLAVCQNTKLLERGLQVISGWNHDVKTGETDAAWMRDAVQAVERARRDGFCTGESEMWRSAGVPRSEPSREGRWNIKTIDQARSAPPWNDVLQAG